MKCIECRELMKYIAGNDDPNEGYAYNVYHCFDCMILAKEDVWENEGIMWIDKKNNIEYTRLGATG